jgi:hypothetical protein
VFTENRDDADQQRYTWIDGTQEMGLTTSKMVNGFLFVGQIRFWIIQMLYQQSLVMANILLEVQ